MGDRASAFSISRRAVFGLDVQLRDAVQYVDHGTLVYCAGKSVIAYDVARESQKFLRVARDVREITAIATHVATSAIALATVDYDGKSSVAVYDAHTLKREKLLTRSDVAPRRGAASDVSASDAIAFDGLAFSNDGASLVAYSTVEYALVVWSVSDGTCVELPRPRQRASSAADVPSQSASSSSSSSSSSLSTAQITHAMFSPHEDGVISAVCAGGIFRTYRVNETTIKLLSATPLNALVKDVGREAASHAWARDDNEHVAVGTSTGELLILEKNDVVCALRVGGAVACVRAYKSGFVVGDGRGRVVIVERRASARTKDGGGGVTYACVKSLIAQETKVEGDVSYDATTTSLTTSLAYAEPVQAADANDGAAAADAADDDDARTQCSGIVALDVSPSGDTLLCILDDKRALALSLANVDIMRADEMRFRRLLPDAHLGGVSSADVCVRKPSIVATVSAADRTVRIWNIASTTPRDVVVKQFPDAPLCVALHPSGWIACVGFSDKLRVLHVLHNDARVVKEFALKACRVVEFARGGHLIASAVGAVVYVHHAFTFDVVAVLRGHCGKVKSLAWRDDDATLISSGADGAIYAWDVHAASRDGGENARRGEHVRKGCAYVAVASMSGIAGGLVACGGDSTLKELDDAFNVVRGFSSDGVMLTHVAYSAKTHRVFAATSAGCVRAYKTPLTGEFVEAPGHVNAITALRLSVDESSLYTVGDDGCLIVYDVRAGDANAASRTGTATTRTSTSTTKSKSQRRSSSASDEVLITRGDLDESQQRIAELQTQVKEVTLQAQYQLRLKTAEMNDRVKTVEDACESKFSMERRRVAALERERDDLSSAMRQEIEDIKDAHAKELTDAEDEYARKMFAEVERFAALEASAAAAAEESATLQARMISAREESETKIKQECALKLNDLRDALAAVERERDAQRDEFATLRRVMEEQVDEEIEQLKASYEARVEREHDAGLVLRGENGVAKTKYALVKQHEDARLEEIAALKMDKRRAAEDVARRDAEADLLRELIHTHERTLDAKNMSLSNANTELARAEKHIAVLAQEVAVLQEQQTPLKARALELERDIETMNEELLRYYNSNSALVRQVCDVKSQRDGLQRDVMRTRKRSADTADVVKRFQRDLHDCANCIQDAKLLKERVKAMYHKYVTDADVIAAEPDISMGEEKRQRDYLEKTVAALKRQLASDAESRRTEFHRIMRENQSLIREVEALRMKSSTAVK